MGGACRPIDVPAPTPIDPFATERGWDCSEIEGDNASGAPKFRASVEALARLIESSIPLDGSVAVTVLLATAGQIHRIAGARISYDGPLTPVEREVILTREQRITLAGRVRALTQPRVLDVADGPVQCGSATVLGRPCAPLEGAIPWAVHQATERLALDTSVLSREVCVVGDVGRLEGDYDDSVVRPGLQEERLAQLPASRALCGRHRKYDDRC